MYAEAACKQLQAAFSCVANASAVMVYQRAGERLELKQGNAMRFEAMLNCFALYVFE